MNSPPSQLARIQPAAFEFTAEQRKIILDSFLSGATEAEAAVLMELARARRLNPITQQIHFVKRWNADKQRDVWAAQVGIDGFRAIAERTGLYGGQDEPEFEYETINGKKVLHKCRVKIYRKDWERPAVGVAFMEEYAQRKKDGFFTKMWMEKPHVMLAKCAEAGGHRKAFPEDAGGLYAPEEGVGELMIEPPEPPQAGKRAVQLKAQIAARLVRDPGASTAPKSDAQAQFKERERLFNDAVGAPGEPPPPSDEDAPSYESAPEEMSDKPRLPPPAVAPVVMSFGSGKGKPLAELQKKDLNWYAKVLSENVLDPAKARFREDNQLKLDAINRELARR